MKVIEAIEKLKEYQSINYIFQKTLDFFYFSAITVLINPVYPVKPVNPVYRKIGGKQAMKFENLNFNSSQLLSQQLASIVESKIVNNGLYLKPVLD